MDVAEAIKRRRSARRYKPDEIPEDVLNRLLDLVHLAPSGSNRQPWKFVVVRDKVKRAQVAAACHYARPNGRVNSQEWIAEAPVIIVACGSESEAAAGYYADGELYVATGQVLEADLGKKPDEYGSFCDVDLAIALDHLSLAAVEEGLGTCWIGGLNEPELKRCLSIPEDWTAQLAMTVGYPASQPEPRPRKPLEEIICYDKFGQGVARSVRPTLGQRDSAGRRAWMVPSRCPLPGDSGVIDGLTGRPGWSGTVIGGTCHERPRIPTGSTWARWCGGPSRGNPT